MVLIILLISFSLSMILSTSHIKFTEEKRNIKIPKNINSKKPINHEENSDARFMAMSNGESSQDPILTNFSLRDIYIYHSNANAVLALGGENDAISIVIITNETIYFYNYSESYVIRVIDLEYIDLDEDNFEELVVLSNMTVTIFSFEGNMLQNFTVGNYDRILVRDIDNDGQHEILLWKYGTPYLGVYYVNGTLISQGELIELIYEDSTVATSADNIMILDAFYYGGKAMLVVQYTSGDETDSLGYLNNPKDPSGNFTATLIEGETQLRIYGAVVGKWNNLDSIFVILRNSTRELETRIYCGFNGKNDSIPIDLTYNDLIECGEYFLALNDSTQDNTSEIVISNLTHIGILFSNTTMKTKNISNIKIATFNGTKITCINSSSVLILNEQLDVVQNYPISNGTLVDLFVKNEKIFSVNTDGVILTIDTDKQVSKEIIAPAFNFLSYHWSINAIVTYTKHEIFANWVGESRFSLSFVTGTVKRASIAKYLVSVLLENGSLIIYNKSAKIVYRKEIPQASIVTGYANASPIFLALENGTLIKYPAEERIAIGSATPVFLDIVNDELVYVFMEVDTLLNTTVLRIDPRTFTVIKKFSITIDFSGFPTLIFYGTRVAFNDINDDNITDLAVVVYGEAKSNLGLYLNVANFSIIKNIDNLIIVSEDEATAAGYIGRQYKVAPFNNNFVLINTSDTAFYIANEYGSVEKMEFPGEKALTASRYAMITNASIRIYYNGSFVKNVTEVTNTSIAFSTILNNSLLIEFLDTAITPRLRQLSAKEDYYAPYISEIRSPKKLSETTLITNNPTVYFDMTIVDDVNLARYNITINNDISSTQEISGTKYNIREYISTDLPDGTYSLKIIIIDAAGRSTGYDYNLVIDTEPPIINIEDRYLTNTTEISITVNITDENYAYADIYLDDIFYTRIYESYKTINITNLNEGTHSFKIMAYDHADNQATKTSQIIVDLTAPNILINSPQNETVTNQTIIELNFTVTDNFNITLIEVYLNENKVDYFQPMNDSIKIRIQLNLNTGTNKVTIIAKDEASNINETTLIIIVDKESPIINVNYPTITNSTKVNVSIEIKDNYGISYTCIYVDGELEQNTTQTSINLTINLEEGEHTVLIRTIDKAGNTAEKTITITVDLTPPDMSVCSPSPGLVTNSSSVLFNVSASDSVGVSEIRVYVDGTLKLSNSSDRLCGSLGLSEGSHSVLVVAYDLAGNRRDSSFTVTVDLTAPIVSIECPTNGTVLNSSVVLVKWSIADMSGITFVGVYVNGSPVLESNELVFSCLLNLSDGNYIVMIVAVDVAGNKGYCIITFSVKLMVGGQSVFGLSRFISLEITALLGYTVGAVYTFRALYKRRR